MGGGELDNGTVLQGDLVILPKQVGRPFLKGRRDLATPPCHWPPGPKVKSLDPSHLEL